MEWIEQFYSRQYLLYPPLLGEVGDKHRTNVAAIARLAGRGPKRVLELGAGGGQVAAAMADAGHDVTAVELVEVAFRHARELADHPRTGSMTVQTETGYGLHIFVSSRLSLRFGKASLSNRTAVSFCHEQSHYSLPHHLASPRARCAPRRRALRRPNTVHRPARHRSNRCLPSVSAICDVHS